MTEENSLWLSICSQGKDELLFSVNKNCSLSVVCISAPCFSSVCNGGGEQYPRERPWPFVDTALWHVPVYQQCLVIFVVSELLLSPEILLSCICSETSPKDNFHCRTDGKRKKMRQSASQWERLSTGAGPQRDGEISILGDFKTQPGKTLNNMT